MVLRKITWTKMATRQLQSAIEYIRQDSPINADSVKEKILKKVGELGSDKIAHRKDPFKKNNDGNYLYFELLRFRIAYYSTPKEVFIIRVRHTSMEPKNY